MRILLIADPMIPVPPKHYGGIERIIDMLARRYTSDGHEVLLIAHPDSDTAGDFVALPGLNYSSRWDVARNAITIARQTRRFRPDVVHSFGRLAQLLPLLPTRIPKVMSYQREPSLPGIARAARLAHRDTLMFTGCSDYISNQIATVGPATTVYNGVPVEHFELQEYIDSDAPLVFLGRVEQIKGVHNAIEIAQRSNRRLVIAGNIPDGQEHAKYFESKVKPHLNERVSYIGPVDDVQKNQLLGEALALVMAIEWNEPFGIVMAEALACGTPVIGTPMGAVPEVVQHGTTGIVASSIAELADAVANLHTIERSACRRACEAQFGDAAIASQYLHVYENLAGANQSPSELPAHQTAA